jgi:hypothetical protein
MGEETCHRHYPGRVNGACSLIGLHCQRPSPCNSKVRRVGLRAVEVLQTNPDNLQTLSIARKADLAQYGAVARITGKRIEEIALCGFFPQ